MKLTDLVLLEKDREDRVRPPSVKGGEDNSTAQAAEKLGLSVSRIRQKVIAGEIETKKTPEKGSRDIEISDKEVNAHAAKKTKKGRPFKGKKGGEYKGKEQD